MANHDVGQDELASVVEQLQQQVLELENRVATLEARPGKVPLPVVPPELTLPPIQRPKPPATWRGFPPTEKQAGAIPVLGKAVLGIAGAYLLRAVAESGAVPQLPVLLVAIAYAAFWLVWAVRMSDLHHFAGVTYAVTSVMILSPLLWESTIRFQVLSPQFTATVLVAFVALALVMSWRGNLQTISWIAVGAAVLTALGLILETRDFVPFTAALLAIGLLTEITAWMGHSSSVRIPPAITADLSLGLFLVVIASPQGIGEGFRVNSPATVAVLSLALLAIYGISIGVRSFWQLHQMTIFEIVQCVLAFAIATVGALIVTNGAIAPALGAAFLLLSAICYWGALSRFLQESHHRNRRLSASWAAALLIAGSLLLLPTSIQIVFLCLASVFSAFVYTRTGKFSLGLHASLFLAAAAAVGPLPTYVIKSLAGSVPDAPGWGVWLVALSAGLCYIVGSRRTEDKRRRRVLWVLPVVLAAFAVAAMVVAAIVSFAGHSLDIASRLSVIRTIVNCLLALALGFAGSRWKRVELGWAAYIAVGFGTLKLLFEDLRIGNAASLVLSLLFYGMVLILLPRFTRSAEPAVTEDVEEEAKRSQSAAVGK